MNITKTGEKERIHLLINSEEIFRMIVDIYKKEQHMRHFAHTNPLSIKKICMCTHWENGAVTECERVTRGYSLS